MQTFNGRSRGLHLARVQPLYPQPPPTTSAFAEGVIYLEKKTVVVVVVMAVAMVVAGRGADEGRGSNTAAINISAG